MINAGISMAIINPFQQHVLEFLDGTQRDSGSEKEWRSIFVFRTIENLEHG
jgi:hypothetical protein